MADDEDRNPARFSKSHQLERDLAHLRDRAGRRGGFVAKKRLDAVDDDKLIIPALHLFKHGAQIYLGEQKQLLAYRAKPLRAHFDLAGALFAAYVKHGAAAAC